MRGKPFKLPTPRILELILIQINFPDLGPKTIDFPDSGLNAIHFADLNVKPIDFGIEPFHFPDWDLEPVLGFAAVLVLRYRRFSTSSAALLTLAVYCYHANADVQ